MIIQASKKVLGNWRYAALSIGVSVCVFCIAVLLPNRELLASIFFHANMPFVQKIAFVFSLLGSIETNFTVFSAVYTIIIAILFGMNMSLMAYHVRHRAQEVRQGGIATGIAGFASGVLGIGCAACGSFLFGAMLPFLGISAGAFMLLPFGGSEFGALGVLLLIISFYQISRAIMMSGVCRA